MGMAGVGGVEGSGDVKVVAMGVWTVLEDGVTRLRVWRW